MPISKENKKLYPKNWKKIRAEILKRAGDQCEKCKVINHAYYNKISRELCLQDEPGSVKIILTIAHLNHNPKDNRRRTLAALCQLCHNRHDAKHRAQSRRKTRYKDQLKMDL